jgi:serine protease Do
MESDKVASKKEDKKSKVEPVANSLGLVLSDLSDAQRKELKIDSGVMVESAEGPAAKAGLRQGDIILSLNNGDFKDVKQFNALVAKLDPKKFASVLVRRENASQFLTIKPNGQ